MVTADVTIVPAPLPPNGVYTTPTFEPEAQRFIPSSLVAARIFTALKFVVVVVVSTVPLLATRPITRRTVAVLVPATASVAGTAS